MNSPADCCQDCGTSLHGRFCAHCGQRAGDHHRSVRQLLIDFGRDVFTVEAKLFQTLKRLVLKPGELTLAYIKGKRTRFVTPLKLYLFISVLFFFLRTVVFQPDTQRITANVESVTTRMTEALSTLGETEAEAAEIREGIDNNVVITKIMALQEQGRLAPFMVTFFNRIPTLMFLMMPIFAVVLRLLYLRHGTKFYYFEHLILSLHTHSVFFLVGAVMVALPDLGPKSFLTIAISLIYLYLSMCTVYGQGRIKTLLKWVILIGIYGFVSTMAIGMLMVFSLARA